MHMLVSLKDRYHISYESTTSCFDSDVLLIVKLHRALIYLNYVMYYVCQQHWLYDAALA